LPKQLGRALMGCIAPRANTHPERYPDEAFSHERWLKVDICRSKCGLLSRVVCGSVSWNESW